MQILKLKKVEQVEEKIHTCAYCRVSSLSDMQEMSLENQISTYDRLIKSNPKYEFIKIYYAQGISGSKENRKGLNEMLNDARKGLFDLIITKSISRFARNTLDCLNYVRELKELGVGVIFEKEGINTLEGSGEVLLTILSSLAQDESRSISENTKWGLHKRYEAGVHKMATKRFLGYDVNAEGKLKINYEQAKIVKQIYKEYLAGKTSEQIKRELEKKKIINWNGKCKWQDTTIDSILQNEKYKGNALLQKSYT